MSLMCSFDPLCNGDSVVYKQTLVVDFCRLHSQRRRRFFLPYTKNIGQFVQKTRKPSLEVANLTQRSRQAIGKSCKCYVQFLCTFGSAFSGDLKCRRHFVT